MPIKIPFWKTVGDAYRFVFGDLPRFARASAAWIATILLLFIVVVAVLGFAIFQQGQAFGASAHLGAGPIVLLAIFGLYVFASNIAFTVAWHRVVLLGEALGLLGTLRFRGREWRFFGYSLLIGLLGVVAFVVAFLIGFGVGFLVGAAIGSGVLTIAARTVLVIVLFVTLTPFLTRFVLGLPAIAVEEPRGVLRRSWRRGRHNGWRLFWGFLLCSLPLGVLAALCSVAERYVTPAAASGGAGWIIGLVLDFVLFALNIIANYLGVAITVSFLSMSYRRLTRYETDAPVG